MKNYIVMTDSCCDLPLSYMERNKIPFVSLTCQFGIKEYIDDFGKSLAPKELFEGMRKGITPKTSQPSVQAFYNVFKENTDQKKDIIYICVSSGLSGTYNSARIARNMILEEKPDAVIEIIDTLTASLGQGLMVISAVKMREDGAGFMDIVDFLKSSVQNLNTYITVDDLNHLKRGGRISATAAILGIVLHVKPVLTINHEGRVMPVIKVKGKKNVINKLAEIVAERVQNQDTEIIAICHGDVPGEAENLKELILQKVKVKDVLINYIGPVVGTHGGPGALAVFFMGKNRQHHVYQG